MKGRMWGHRDSGHAGEKPSPGSYGHRRDRWSCVHRVLYASPGTQLGLFPISCEQPSTRAC